MKRILIDLNLDDVAFLRKTELKKTGLKLKPYVESLVRNKIKNLKKK